MRSHRTRTVAALAVLLLAACSARELSLAPNLYARAGRAPFADLDARLASDSVDLLYVTDRVGEAEDDGALRYGSGRSPSMLFGSAVVTIGDAVGWKTLRTATAGGDRDVELPLALESIVEGGSFPPTPYRGAEDLDLDRRAGEALAAEIVERLSRTPAKRVLVFVHGFNNTFEDAAFDLAELWHYLGREGVPLLYSWPAGRGGALGYAYDRESGEFTVFHLKQLIRRLESIPEIESIQLVAHSRGTGVATSALRELAIEARATGENPRETLRISDLVLLAPDLDERVFAQRFVAEGVHEAVGRVTIYASGEDKAIRAAEWVFGGFLRLGRATEERLAPEALDLLGQLGNVDLVEVRGDAEGFGHTYFLSSPAALSDLILLLRDGRPPGAEHGRPLTRISDGFWVAGADYPVTTDSELR